MKHIPHVPVSCLLLGAALLLAALPPGAIARGRQTSIHMEQITGSARFMSAHPDMRWRREGMEAYETGQYAFAAGYFRRAAQYADKPSQAMYAEMLWNGEGVEQDRELAYAWMDLAAERGYPPFLMQRENYWAALGPAERERAVHRGQEVYEEYGDAVAKPRKEEVLRRNTRRGVTGSRVGAVHGRLSISFPDGVGEPLYGGITTGAMDGAIYYQDRYWKPRAYWAWQDRTWGLSRTGDATVGDLEALDRKQERNGDTP